MCQTLLQTDNAFEKSVDWTLICGDVSIKKLYTTREFLIHGETPNIEETVSIFQKGKVIDQIRLQESNTSLNQQCLPFPYPYMQFALSDFFMEARPGLPLALCWPWFMLKRFVNISCIYLSLPSFPGSSKVSVWVNYNLVMYLKNICRKYT